MITKKIIDRVDDVAKELGCRWFATKTSLEMYKYWPNGVGTNVVRHIESAEDAMAFEALCRKEFNR